MKIEKMAIFRKENTVGNMIYETVASMFQILNVKLLNVILISAVDYGH